MLLSALTLAAAVLTNAVQISAALANGRTDARFSFSGTVTLPPGPRILFTAIDETGGVSLYVAAYRLRGMRPLKAGDRITASGKMSTIGAGILIADCTNLTFVARGDAPAPRTVTAEDLQTGRLDGLPVEIDGTVRECFRDEIDPQWTYLSVTAEGKPFFAILNQPPSLDLLKALEDADVTISGVCFAHDSGNRRMTGRLVYVSSPDSIRIRKANADPFAVPLLEDWQCFSPERIAGLGKRRLRGQVIAVLENGTALLRTASGAAHKVGFKHERPACGQFIEATGWPETDLYRINLSNAKWQPVQPFPVVDKGTFDLTAADLFTDEKGDFRINSRYHGKVVRLVGTVMDLPTSRAGQGIAILKSQDFTIPVDISADNRIHENISVGCEVEVTGVCFVQSENWSPCTPFPHTTGLALALRTPDDIRILSRPPWLTPARMTTIVGILLLALVLILIWNRILQRIIDRKSRQLVREQFAKKSASLRLDERNRLAVELHDTLSQNLAGVACQIAATKGSLTLSPDTVAESLGTAERMLLSCRTELKRCLWDLRENTLGFKDFTEALQRTLSPIAADSEITIRFNVPRTRLSDSAAHAVICIVRELVSNAIRHGKAQHVRVAGEFHGGAISFSVRDDGIGFSPECHADPTEGHFGLQGIRERLKSFRGTLDIDSRPGEETRISVALKDVGPQEERNLSI